MKFAEIRRLIANPNDHRIFSKTYAIGNEYGLLAIAYADCALEALDEALDAGRLDSELMPPEVLDEYVANGWDDSYALLGNAGEPVYTEYLTINEITRG